MGGSGGMFGTSKQKAATQFKMSAAAREGEGEAIQRQRNIASGKSPSIANRQFNANMDASARQAMAMAASQRGTSNPALAYRQAQLGNQQMNLEAAQQGAIMAEQERRLADEFLAKQAAAQRGVAVQSGIANQQNDAAKSSRDMKYTYEATAGVGQSLMESMSDERAKENIEEKTGSADAIEEFVNAGREKAKNNEIPVPANVAPPVYQKEEPFPEKYHKGGGGGSGKGMASMFAMMSDKRAKKDINSNPGSSDEIGKFINALHAYEYEYKDPQHGTGKKMGVMAQDLEKTEVGRTMVDKRPDGLKVIDTNKAIGVALAAIADLNQKIKKVSK